MNRFRPFNFTRSTRELAYDLGRRARLAFDQARSLPATLDLDGKLGAFPAVARGLAGSARSRVADAAVKLTELAAVVREEWADARSAGADDLTDTDALTSTATPLTTLPGVGPATAAKLAAAGVESVEQLRAADPDVLASRVKGLSAERIRRLQAA